MKRRCTIQPQITLLIFSTFPFIQGKEDAQTVLFPTWLSCVHLLQQRWHMLVYEAMPRCFRIVCDYFFVAVKTYILYLNTFMWLQLGTWFSLFLRYDTVTCNGHISMLNSYDWEIPIFFKYIYNGRIFDIGGFFYIFMQFVFMVSVVHCSAVQWTACPCNISFLQAVCILLGKITDWMCYAFWNSL